MVQDRWLAGVQLAAECSAEGVLLTPLANPFAPTQPNDVFSSLRYTGGPKSVEDMKRGS